LPVLNVRLPELNALPVATAVAKNKLPDGAVAEEPVATVTEPPSIVPPVPPESPALKVKSPPDAAVELPTVIVMPPLALAVE
jgi:hypothetical protein